MLRSWYLIGWPRGLLDRFRKNLADFFLARTAIVASREALRYRGLALSAARALDTATSDDTLAPICFRFHAEV